MWQSTRNRMYICILCCHIFLRTIRALLYSTLLRCASMRCCSFIWSPVRMTTFHPRVFITRRCSYPNRCMAMAMRLGDSDTRTEVPTSSMMRVAVRNSPRSSHRAGSDRCVSAPKPMPPYCEVIATDWMYILG